MNRVWVSLLLLLTCRVDAARDYVSVRSLASDFGVAFGETVHEEERGPGRREVTLGAEMELIRLRPGTREAWMEGVKHWLSYSVVDAAPDVRVSQLDLASVIEPVLHPGEMPLVETVVLDPGHGGKDTGARSRLGYEKDFALDCALRARRMLEDRGIRVVMTRDKDIFVPLHIRAAIANREPNPIMVSIHFNAAVRRGVMGFEVFCLTPRGAPSTDEKYAGLNSRAAEPGNLYDRYSVILADRMQRAMLEVLPQEDRGVKRARFAVLRLTRAPSVLVEGGFISTSRMSRLVRVPAWRDEFARALVQGIVGYRSLAPDTEVGGGEDEGEDI